MRISVVGLRGIPGVMGGVETHCEELFPRLGALRPKDEIAILMRRAYAPTGVENFRGLRLVSLPHMRGKSWEAISNTACGIFYGRFRLKADIVHIQGIGPALFAPIARLLGQSVIVTYHSRNYEHAKWNWIGRLALRIGEFTALCFADRVIVIADWLGRDVRRRYPAFADKVHVVPNGADHLASQAMNTEAAAALMVRHELTPKSFVICVGRLVPEKGFEIAIDAIERAPQPMRLVICGAADHADDYSRSLLARAGARVVFTGALDRPTLSALLAQASLFALPSYHEGLPIAALEAATVGLPILLSDIEPNLDLKLPSNNYFRAGNAEDLARKLALPHPSYAVDREGLLKRYAWDSSARILSTIYTDVLTASHAVRAPPRSVTP